MITTGGGRRQSAEAGKLPHRYPKYLVSRATATRESDPWRTQTMSPLTGRWAGWEHLISALHSGTVFGTMRSDPIITSLCDALLARARRNPAGLRIGELRALANCFGWTFARSSGSHHIFKRHGNRTVMNFQAMQGMAKAYQVRQLIRAIDQLSDEGR